MSEPPVAAAGEGFLLEFRRHAYVLVLPALVLGGCSGVGAFLVATVPDSGARAALRWVISAGVVAVALRWALWPFALWYANRHVLTTARVVHREGVLARHGAELAVTRIAGIALSRSVLQRALGAGRLTLEFIDPEVPGGRGTWVMDDVPLVAQVQQVLLSLSTGSPPPGPAARSADPALPER